MMSALLSQEITWSYNRRPADVDRLIRAALPSSGHIYGMGVIRSSELCPALEGAN